MNDKPETPLKITGIMSRAGIMIGKRVDNKLMKPRILTSFEQKEIDPATRKEVVVPKIHLAPLPGLPPYYTIGANEGHYTIPAPPKNKQLYDLYERVTNPQVDPGE